MQQPLLLLRRCCRCSPCPPRHLHAVPTIPCIPPTRAGRDVECLVAQGLEPRQVGVLLLDAFAAQTYAHGFTHGDPHAGGRAGAAEVRCGAARCCAVSLAERRGGREQGAAAACMPAQDPGRPAHPPTRRQHPGAAAARPRALAAGAPAGQPPRAAAGAARSRGVRHPAGPPAPPLLPGGCASREGGGGDGSTCGSTCPNARLPDQGCLSLALASLPTVVERHRSGRHGHRSAGEPQCPGRLLALPHARCLAACAAPALQLTRPLALGTPSPHV